MSYTQLPAKALLCALGFSVMMANAAMAADATSQAPQAQATQARIMVHAVTFSGNRTFTSDQLNAPIAGDLGRSMSLAEMKALAAKVEAYYHSAGYKLVKVVVPAQDFANEKALKLAVLEGWLGHVQVKGAKRFSSEQVINALNAGGVVSDKPFTLEEVERALTHLNRLSGVEVSATLQPGSETGSTDLVVDVTEAPRIQGAMEANN